LLRDPRLHADHAETVDRVTTLGFFSSLMALSRWVRGIAVPRRAMRAEATRVSICSLASQLFGSSLAINTVLESKGNLSQFRAKPAIPCNIASREVAL
jgi:hypothetical protein